jgi:hypothetical protein
MLTPLVIVVSLVLSSLSKNTIKPFIASTNKVSYTPTLVTRQLRGIQYVPRTTKLSQFSGLFKDQSALEVMENIKQDWKLLVSIKKKELDGLRDLVTSEKYPRWRNLSLVTFFMNLEFKTETSQTAELNKRKRINNEEELREQLEKLYVELGTNKALKISLEEQLFIEDKLRKFME